MSVYFLYYIYIFYFKKTKQFFYFEKTKQKGKKTVHKKFK